MFLLLIVLPLSACWDANDLEDLLIVYGVGIDIGRQDPDKYLITIGFPTIIDEAPEAKYTIATEAKSFTDGKEHLQHKVYRKITYGNIRVIVFSHEVAEKGIIQHLDCMLREPIFPGTLRFVVVDTTANELLDMEPPVSLFVSTFLFKAIEQNYQYTNVPFTTLRNFHYQYYTSGIEPVVPHISFNVDTNQIEISSVALFKDDKMIHRLDYSYSTYFMLLTGQINQGFYATTYPADEEMEHYISIRFNGGKSKIKSELVDSKLHINQEITIKAHLAEFTSQESVFDPEMVKKFEAFLSAHFEEKLKETVRILQNLKSDNVGYGLYVRADQPEYFDPDIWGDQFSNAEINIKVNVKMHTVGITH